MINLQKKNCTSKSSEEKKQLNKWKKRQVNNYKSCMFKHDVSDKFGKKLKQNKTHGNSNGKSSSPKMREVPNIIAIK